MTPIDAYRYPENWHELAAEIKSACDWQCQECGQQCRRPGEAHDTMRRTLSVAHYFHDYDSPEVFVTCLCMPCHLKHDAAYIAQKRRQFYKRNHMALIRRESALTREDVDALAADWPEMPDLDGVDLFLETCGQPTGSPNMETT
jgi:hypothetical protein